MKRRKWISLLLCGVLILATLPTTALAEGTEMEADAGVQVESVSEEMPVEAPEANSESDSEEAPEKIVEIKEEETVEEAPEEEIPEENPENTSEEVPAETEQESIPTEESLNLEKSVTVLAANYALTTLKSPGIAVQAGTSVSYCDEKGAEHTANCNGVITQANIGNYGILTTGWYAVEGTVTGDNRIEVQGTVNLILEDGCSFTVNGGIEVNVGNALTRWGQQKGNGKLKAQNVVNYCAGIGGGDGKSGGNITINGGIIQSEGRFRGAGIGGGSRGAGGIITINNGEIQSKGGYSGAGIGGGGGGAGGTITINAGKIQSEGGYGGAGIGGGVNAAGGTITMNGGEITASGETKENRQIGKAAGIGGGFGSKGLGGTILITCGTIRAKGGEAAAGIGSGNAADGTGNIHIQGGIIYASTNIADGQNESFFERFYAIGGGSGWTDGSITITNGVVITKGQIDKSNKDTWSGIIFENSEVDGIVYGDPTLSLSQKFTLEAKQNLLIPENTSLQGTANLTNDGNIYVSGTLAESVSGSGKVHYALTVTGGTAGGDVSTYKNQLYGKTGGLVTLNATNVPVGQAAGWSCSDNTVTIAKDAFTMPARKLTVTAQYTNAPSYTVTIPASVELGNTAKIQAEDVNVVSGSQLVVRLSNANGLKLTTPEGAEQLYTIKNGETSIRESDAVLTVAGGTADNSGTVSLNFAPDGEPKYAGVYTGTVMFSVSVEAASNP